MRRAIRTLQPGLAILAVDAAQSRPFPVAVEFRQRRHQLVHQLIRERVQRLGPVEQNEGNGTVGLDED